MPKVSVQTVYRRAKRIGLACLPLLLIVQVCLVADLGGRALLGVNNLLLGAAFMSGGAMLLATMKTATAEAFRAGFETAKDMLSEETPEQTGAHLRLLK